MSDRCDGYNRQVGYCEGHAVFDECGDDDGDATAGDDVRCVHEGHDGRHDWQNEGVSAFAGKKDKRRTRGGEDEEKTPADTPFLDTSDKPKR